MKSVILSFGLLFSLMSFAATPAAKPKLIVDTKAVIEICPKGLMGCANKIVIKGTSYIIGYDKAADKDGSNSELVSAIIGANSFHKIKKSLPFTAEGYVTKEKGHFPNPMAEFTVFKITALSKVLLPK